MDQHLHLVVHLHAKPGEAARLRAVRGAQGASPHPARLGQAGAPRAASRLA
jgi:hypothetical protein